MTAPNTPHRAIGYPPEDRAERLRRQERAAWWSLVEAMRTLAETPVTDAADANYHRERVFSAKASWRSALMQVDGLFPSLDCSPSA